MGAGFTTAVVRAVEWANLVVTPRIGAPKERRFVRLSGWTSCLQFGVHNHNLTNVLRGLRERVFAVERNGKLVPPPKPVEGCFSRLSKFRAGLLRKLGHRLPYTQCEFISTYTGHKRDRVVAAFESLLARPVCRRDGWLSTFVKAEKINLTSKPDPAPRVIQPRDTRYNCMVGPYIKSLEHHVYGAIAWMWGGPTVMKGLNAGQVGTEAHLAWQKFAKPCAIGLDASRFDQHVSKAALEWEHSVYNSVFQSKELRKLLKWQVYNRGIARVPEGVVRYSVDGCRMSGDMNTALGNCLLMCALVWEFCRERGVRARLLNNGDDCTLICESADEPKLRRGLEEWFLEFGFTMKVEPTVYRIQEIEFCQTHPICVDGDWVMVRDPRVALAKDLMCLHPDTANPIPAYHAWAAAVGNCGMSICGGVPIMQEHYRRMMNLGRANRRVQGFGSMSTGFEYLAKGMAREYRAITPETRAQFYWAFGILPDLQIALEEEIGSMTYSPDISPMMTRSDFQFIRTQ